MLQYGDESRRRCPAAPAFALALLLGPLLPLASAAPAAAAERCFPETGQCVSGPFLDYWRANGRIDGMGYPLCESYKPDEDTEIQWFERARVEWHRDLPEGRRIVLGNIGTEALRLRGWIK